MSCAQLSPGEIGPAARKPLAARPVNRPRRRRLLWLAPLALVVAGGALWGARWLLTTDRFAVARVETGPYRFTDPRQLEARLASVLGSNLWTGAAARRLAAELPALPWVKRARIARELPGTLKVELEEWRPLLEVAPDSSRGDVAGALVLLGDGRVETFPPHLPRPDLPLLVGARLAPRPGGGRCLAPGQADSVLALAAAVAETGLEGWAPVDFLVDGAEGLSIVLQGGRARLVVGGEEFPGRLRRFLAVCTRMPEGAVVDLRFDRRVFVNGQEAGEGTPGAPGSRTAEQGAAGARDRTTVAAPAPRREPGRAGTRA